MYPIPANVFQQRLRRWHSQPDRKTVETQDERGRTVKEWWSTGVCRLRTVRHRDGIELLADRGLRGATPAHTYGKISFTTWDDWTPPVRAEPPPIEWQDWAE